MFSVASYTIDAVMNFSEAVLKFSEPVLTTLHDNESTPALQSSAHSAKL